MQRRIPGTTFPGGAGCVYRIKANERGARPSVIVHKKCRMQVRRFLLGPLDTNSHVLAVANKAIAIDVGGNPRPIVRYLAKNGLELQAVFVTHLHCDHLYGVAELARRCAVKIHAPAKDRPLLEAELGRGGLAWLPLVPAFSWEPLAPGETRLLGQPCQILATPGHSAGSVSYYFPEAGAVFVGDLLFQQSLGRTDLMGGSYDTLIRSVTDKIFPLPDATQLYPGHGPSSTVGEQKQSNPFLQHLGRAHGEEASAR